MIKIKYNTKPIYLIIFLLIISLCYLKTNISILTIKSIIVFTSLLLASIQDIKTRIVDDCYSITIFVASFIDISMQDVPYMILSGVILFMFLFFLVVFLGDTGIGGSDIKILSAFACYIGLFDGITTLFIALILSVIINKLSKSTSFAFVPHIFCGGLLIYFI